MDDVKLHLPWTLDDELSGNPGNIYYVVASDARGGIAFLLPVDGQDPDDVLTERARAEEIIRVMNASVKKH